MNEIYEQADDLAKTILNSDEYIRYSNAKAALSQNIELKERVDRYRRDNFYLQNSYSDSKIDEYHKLENEYHELTKYAEAKEYLDAELIFVRLMRKTMDILVESVDVDINI